MPESILIVDDEPGLVAALAVRLEAAGYDIHCALSGLAGLDAAERHRPDVIVLDIRMPDVDGYEVCARLKRRPEFRDTPIIFLSANVQDSARQHAMDVGAAAFLSKPYEACDIFAAIERVTGKSSELEKETISHERFCTNDSDHR